MKSFKKVIFILFLFCLITLRINADDTFDLSAADIKCDEAKTTETIQKCKASIEYCWGQNKREAATYTGCFFNKNDPFYSTTTLGADSWSFGNGDYSGKPYGNSGIKDANGNVVNDTNIKDSLYYKGSPNDAWANIYGMTFRIYNDIPYERAYAAIVNSSNEVTSLGCYKGYAKVRQNHKINYLYGVEEKAEPYETIAFDVVKEACDYKKDPDCMGPVLIFKLFSPNNKEGCSMKMVKMVLPTTFNTEQKNASTNLLKTSVYKNLKAQDSYYDETDSGLLFPPKYVEYNNTNYAKLRTDSKCKERSSCKGNACDFCYTDLNRINFSEIRVETPYGRSLGYGQTTYGSKNIYNMLGLNDSAIKLDPDNAHCPLYFYINPNVGSDYINKYRVSNSENDNKYDGKNYALDTFLKDIFTKGSFYENGTHYKGCTSDDTEGYEEIKKCLEESKKTINNKTCPSNNDSYSAFVSGLESIQTSCKEKYKELYARFLMMEDNKELDKIVKDAKNEKVDQCFYTNCGFTTQEQNAIKKELEKSENAKCSDGCRVTNVSTDVSNTEGKCIACGGSQGVTYKWASKDYTPSGNCSVVDLSYDKCLGNSNTQECFNCLNNVYKKLNITDDKINCINEAFKQREKVKNDTDDAIDDQSQDYTDKTSIENAERASDPFTYFRIPGLSDGGFGPAGQNCEEILQNNGIKLLIGIVNALRIAGAIIAIANAMITLIPAVISKDAEGLKKAGRKLVTMAVILAIIGILPSIVNLIGLMFGYDLSCLF